ncbi:ParA family protein [Shewanella sp. 4t3-1-2LB]|uniref:ParA family protein n=1 Tax=Shewanella sp. 4t3-1-2LB TaxID=2817682 RepID=UPI001A9980F7|nr:ParA family protein [Shewanella sp. 4t3-1-2LB]MBO1273582.1 ParA family protein [Shewanella sp. 4t3-1-2LB]
MKIIQIGNRKGGVGKTTTTNNLAWELVKAGKKVLSVDFDGQGNLTTMLLGDEPTKHWIGDVLLDHRFDIAAAIYPACIDGKIISNLDVIPGRSGDHMTKLDMEMISLTKREERLSLQLKKLEHHYDYVLIDTNPGTSVLSLNAVTAADLYIIPTTYRDMSFDGIETFLQHVSDVRFIEEDQINYVILRTALKRASKRELEYGNSRIQAQWPNSVAKTVIWDRSVFGEAELSRMPVSLFAPGHPAAAYYKDFAREIMNG